MRFVNIVFDLGELLEGPLRNIDECFYFVASLGVETSDRPTQLFFELTVICNHEFKKQTQAHSPHAITLQRVLDST